MNPVTREQRDEAIAHFKYEAVRCYEAFLKAEF